VAREREEGGAVELEALGLEPERIHAEPAFAAYATARSEAREEARALFLESEDALGRMLGRAGDDPWAWGRLSDLYEWEGQLGEAKSALERGLKRIPEDVGLIERLARVSRALEGPAATVKTFEAYVAAHPEVPAGRWQLAIARFALALDGYLADPRVLEPERFAAAEADFRALREQFPDFTTGALGYEVVCRLARGWCAFHTGDLDGAEREFLSMNELFERGIEWSRPRCW
jgi:tetratricopeptide (TPR) repeat protein